MALPSKTDVLKLQYSADGSPWVRVVQGTTDPNTLALSADGSPWWGVAESGFNLYIGDVQVSAMYVGETAVSAAYIGETAL